MALKLLIFLLPLGFAIYRYSHSARHASAQIRARSEPLRDPRLVLMTHKLAQTLEIPPPRIYVEGSPAINAMVMPDGQIFLTRGMVSAYEAGHFSAEEIASVIAHELGHVALGHTDKRTIDFAKQHAMRTGLVMVFSRLIPVIGPWVGNILFTAASTRLPRQNEFDADAYASAVLEKSGIGITPQITIFEKLDAAERADVTPVWLRGHPPMRDRIEAIRRNMATWGARG